MENRALRNDFSLALVGQIVSALLIICILVVAVIFALHGQVWASVSLCSYTIIGLAVVYVLKKEPLPTKTLPKGTK